MRSFMVSNIRGKEWAEKVDFRVNIKKYFYDYKYGIDRKMRNVITPLGEGVPHTHDKANRLIKKISTDRIFFNDYDSLGRLRRIA